ncbi:MAG: hypothetical protein A2Y23_08430 [Clostridiales bacterium GWB2_37_7]|nr:MAG: hypothetical protein A2Y23_08430 [Clostridiales bacterium GWB2_37_7]
MKILILYFSGTGNTEFVSRYIKEHLMSDIYEITQSPIESFKKESISQYDTLFFGFPVYACNVPKIVRSYLQDIPVTITKTAFIFCTKAFFTGDAMKNAIAIFNARGYVLTEYADVNMPGSDGLAFLKKDSQTVSKIINKDFSKLEQVDDMISRSKNIMELYGEDNMKQYRAIVRPTIVSSLISKILEKAFQFIESRLERKLIADENCVRCLKCEKICPAKNIKVNKEGVLFGGNCYLCMRCLHQCPKEAIQIGKKTIGKFRWKGPQGDYEPQQFE